MNQAKMPQDYEGGVQEFLEDGKDGGGYEDLPPLSERKTSEIRVRAGEGEANAAALAKYQYSRPIAEVSALAQKLYGYERDGNLKTHLQQSAVKGANSLNDLILDAPCVNRQGRFDEEEARAKQWNKLIEANPRDTDKDDKDDSETLALTDLSHRWSEAEAFMMQARIVEEQHGIEAAVHLHAEYALMEERLKNLRMEASRLPPAENMLFWCRVRQYGIMREGAYDKAMGYPTHDFTEVKADLANGAGIHDLVHRMPWAFRESYQEVMASMLDGESHRTLLMAMIAGQLPAQPMPMAMPTFFQGGMSPNGQNGQQEGDDGDGGQGDKRGALFGFFGGGKQNGAPEQPKQIRRRASRRSNR